MSPIDRGSVLVASLGADGWGGWHPTRSPYPSVQQAQRIVGVVDEVDALTFGCHDEPE